MQSPQKRIPQRLVKSSVSNFVQPPVGISAPADGQAASVAVDVYAKTHIAVNIDVGPSTNFAGKKLPIEIQINTSGKGKFYDIKVIGRAISPAFNLGNLLADTSVIPLKSRQKFTNKKTRSFNELAFLAAVEEKKPEAIQIKDRELKFQGKRDAGIFISMVEDTKHPGVYWISARVEGMWKPDNGPAERFSRVISKQVAVGIRLATHIAKPTLHWVNTKRFIVRLFAGDELGNIAAAPLMDSPATLIQKRVNFSQTQSEP